jgi:Flp pilus assembly protein TadB
LLKFDSSVPCPHCGKAIHPQAAQCRHCQAALASYIPPASSISSSSAGASVLTVFALLVAVGSWLFVSPATAGVAGVGCACLLGIVARMVQAQHHQRLLLQQLARQNSTEPT